MDNKTPEKSDPTVRVYNKGRRSFTHGPHTASPASFCEVPQSVANLWFRLFEGEVIEAGVAQKELGGVQAELAAAKARIAELEAAVAAAPAVPAGKKKAGATDAI